MASSFSIDIKFNDSYYKKLGLNNEYENILSDSVDHALHDADTIIKREVPRPGHGRGKYYEPTGNLQRSFRKVKTGRLSGILRTNVFYWVYVEYGTPAHKIKARKGKVLVFEGHDGKLVYTKEVSIPTMPANPFVRRTAKKVKPLFLKYVKEAFQRNGITK